MQHLEPDGLPRRPHSRRGERRPYSYDRQFTGAGLRPYGESGDPVYDAIAILRNAGRLQSALRRATRGTNIDFRLARLLLVLRPGPPTRVADIAWDLGITSGAASRLCDAAEERALVDKLYDAPHDRRGTNVTLTASGRAIREQVVEILRAPLSTDRPRGVAYGRRYFTEFYPLDDL